MKELSKNEILIAKLATQLYSSTPPTHTGFGVQSTTVEECVRMAKKIIAESRLGLTPRDRKMYLCFLNREGSVNANNIGN